MLGAYREALNKEKVRSEKQKFWLRWVAVGFASLIITFLLAIVGFHAFSPAFSPERNCYLPPFEEYSEIPHALVISSPIVAATAITIFLPIGIFQGFKPKDMEVSTAQAMSRTAAGGGSGGLT